ncbi:LptF/LptG family permease [Psittacicella gerlachiana]|uniref:LptF/LptG family permease n=1 Tax=Psittacicella gerlachiana TaxID=2028574 RepID=UPI001CA77C52|nr:LptF/LptG family permease [Psittacicella gerlachiana]
MTLFRILDRYLVKKVSITVTFTLIGLVLFSLIIRITEEISNVGRGAYTLTDALLYSLMLAAPDINTFFPMAGLLGAMIALGQMASHSELIIIQSVGVSRLRIFLGLLWFIIPFSLLNLAVQQWVAPQAASYGYAMKSAKLNNGNFYTSNQTLWSKANGEFVYAQVGNQANLQDILILQYDETNYAIKKIIIGERALWDNQDKLWHIQKVQEFTYQIQNDSGLTTSQEQEIKNNINQDNQFLFGLLQKELATNQSFNVKLYSNYVWESTLTPDKLLLVNQDRNNFTLTSLWSYISFLTETNQNSDSYRYLFWSKVFAGLSFFVMMFVATSSIFGNMRNVSIMLKIFFAVILGLVFYVLNNTVGPLLTTYGLAPIVASLIPSLLFFIYGLYLARRK